MKRRYSVAVHDEVVVGSRRAYYPIVVIHIGGASGPFASFHPSEAHANMKGLEAWKDTAPHKFVQASIETTTYVAVGTTLTPDLVRRT